MRFPFLFILLTFLASCETISVEKVSARANTVMIIPLQTLHSELQLYADPLQKTLVERFKAKHFHVQVLSLSDFEQMKTEAFTVSGSVYDPSVGHVIPLKAAVFTKTFIDLVREKYAYDVIVFPEFVLRTANIQGDEVEWDGVTRDVTWQKKPKEPFTLPDRTSALSLKLGVFTDTGVKVNTYFGGVGLPYNLTLKQGKIGYQLKSPILVMSELNNAIKLTTDILLKQVVYYEK